jgi:uncharacterized NAD(P)/FAD-binding protein YdhS
MSAFSARPADFLEWARRRHPEADGEDYLPRAWYGDYLADRLEEARARSAHAFQHIPARVTGLMPAADGAHLVLDDGSALVAGKVLLALGNSPQSGAVAGADPEHVASNPWEHDWLDALPRRDARVLLIGSGLTMIDIALHIAATRPQARMLAVSRHGWLPRTQGVPWPSVDPLPELREVFPRRGTIRERLRGFREWTAHGDWHLAVQSVRESLPQVWRDATRVERARFLRHLRSLWDVHRHRVPPITFARIESLKRNRRLRVVAGRILATRRKGATVTATWRRRGSEARIEERVHAVVNVSGPEGDLRRSADPLVQSLFQQGLCRQDELRLGLDFADDGRLVGAGGRPAPNIYYVGPALRARYWEATAVPELRGHVERTIGAILAG